MIKDIPDDVSWIETWWDAHRKESGIMWQEVQPESEFPYYSFQIIDKHRLEIGRKVYSVSEMTHTGLDHKLFYNKIKIDSIPAEYQGNFVIYGVKE